MAVALLSAGLFAWSTRAKADGGGRKAVEKVPAVYPLIAKANRIKGVVRLEIVVRENGSVKSTKVLGGSPLLIGSATDAVCQWKFEPAAHETTEVVQVQFGD
jgi:TonB family protein